MIDSMRSSATVLLAGGGYFQAIDEQDRSLPDQPHAPDKIRFPDPVEQCGKRVHVFEPDERDVFRLIDLHEQAGTLVVNREDARVPVDNGCTAERQQAVETPQAVAAGLQLVQLQQFVNVLEVHREEDALHPEEEGLESLDREFFKCGGHDGFS